MEREPQQGLPLRNRSPPHKRYVIFAPDGLLKKDEHRLSFFKTIPYGINVTCERLQNNLALLRPRGGSVNGYTVTSTPSLGGLPDATICGWSLAMLTVFPQTCTILANLLFFLTKPEFP